MAWAGAPDDWTRRLATLKTQAGLPEVLPRIRVAVYRGKLERWIAAGLRTGDPLPGSPVGGDNTAVITQGPLKVIADGSMGTASAHMCEPYPPEFATEHPYGVANIGRAELTALMLRATQAGYEAAIHAIGDAQWRMSRRPSQPRGRPGASSTLSCSRATRSPGATVHWQPWCPAEWSCRSSRPIYWTTARPWGECGRAWRSALMPLRTW